MRPLSLSVLVEEEVRNAISFYIFNQEDISNLIVSYLLHHTPPSRQVSFFFHQSCPSFLWLQPFWWRTHLFKLVFCSAASSHSSNQSFKGYFSSSHFVFCKVEEEPVLKMKLPDGQSVTGLRQSVSFISKSHHQDKGRGKKRLLVETSELGEIWAFLSRSF